MPASQPSGQGDLNQELIDQMLNGGDLGGVAEADPWSEDTLQAEIDVARVGAGVGLEDPEPMPASMSKAMSTPVATMPERSQPTFNAPPPTAVHPVQFMPLTPDVPSTDRAHGIELLMDVALEVSVELGRSHMPIGDILALRTGSVIELDKLAGETVDVSVNGTLIARGEVVVVDEKFGVRITEVVSKSRRLASVA